MANENDTSAADQALADEWAAALEETGDVGQADIDALLAADAAQKPAPSSSPASRTSPPWWACLCSRSCFSGS